MLFNSSDKKAPLDKSRAQDAVRMLETISPLVKNIYSSRALFVINQGISNLLEIVCYLLGLASIAFSFIMNTVFPFHVLGEIISKRVYEDALTAKGEIETFNLAVKGLVILIGLFFILIGIMIRNHGKRKSLLQMAGKELKSVESFFLEVKKDQPSTDIEVQSK